MSENSKKRNIDENNNSLFSNFYSIVKIKIIYIKLLKQWRKKKNVIFDGKLIPLILLKNKIYKNKTNFFFKLRKKQHYFLPLKL